MAVDRNEVSLAPRFSAGGFRQTHLAGNHWYDPPVAWRFSRPFFLSGGLGCISWPILIGVTAGLLALGSKYLTTWWQWVLAAVGAIGIALLVVLAVLLGLAILRALPPPTIPRIGATAKCRQSLAGSVVRSSSFQFRHKENCRRPVPSVSSSE